jgi:2-(1,2-epoxy-1,2-dihydrophenyl)acetyl-CoA isomerase
MTDELSEHDPVVVVTIDNPAQRNALDDASRRALLAAIRKAVDAPSRVVVLTGAGGTFCAGGELRSMPATDAAAVTSRMGEMHDIVRTIITASQPVIGAVEGFAYGSGLSLAAACDIVVAADNARFGCTFGRVGLMADCGLLMTLPRRVGPAKAKVICLSNAILDAADALELGLVDELVEPGNAESRAIELASQLSKNAPLAMAATKRMLTVFPRGIDDLLARELDEQIALFASDDFRHGRDAFLGRSDPAFLGH